MKNLIAELLVRLAEKEEESKEREVQVAALEIVVTASLRKLDCSQRQQITDSINAVIMDPSSDFCPANTEDFTRLNNYIQRLLAHSRS